MYPFTEEQIQILDHYADLWQISFDQACKAMANLMAAFAEPVKEVIQRLQEILDAFPDLLAVPFIPVPIWSRTPFPTHHKRQALRPVRTYPYFRNLLPLHRHNPATVPKISYPC